MATRSHSTSVMGILLLSRTSSRRSRLIGSSSAAAAGDCGRLFSFALATVARVSACWFVRVGHPRRWRVCQTVATAHWQAEPESSSFVSAALQGVVQSPPGTSWPPENGQFDYLSALMMIMTTLGLVLTAALHSAACLVHLLRSADCRRNLFALVEWKVVLHRNANNTNDL